MNNYWIANPEGEYALVDGAAARDEWIKVRGWHEAGEPGPTDQVHVVNENPEVGPGRLPYAAVALHAGLGWKAGPPPSPVDVTKDSVLVDPAPVVGEQAKPKTQSAAGGDSSKEK